MPLRPWRPVQPSKKFVGVSMVSLSMVSFSISLPIMAVMVAGLLTGTALGAAAVVVSQKGRAFEPNRVSIKRDQTLEIVNDDGDLLHHAYLKSDSFSFDSGDQEPGSKFDVTFPVAGEFTILCAIHPKMKLVVVVE